MKKFFTFGDKRYRCVQCNTLVSYVGQLKNGFFGYCSTCDENLQSIQVYRD